MPPIQQQVTDIQAITQMLLANIQQQMQEVNTQTPTSNEEIMA